MADSDVQLAIILQRLEALTDITRVGLDDLRRIMADHETRLRELETSATQLRERMTLWQMGQAAFTTIAASIAALLGRNS